MSVAALAEFLRIRDDADPAVAPALRSVVRAGDSDRIIVLLHGLTASPTAWSSLADDLRAAGDTVVSVRLPLHGHADRLTGALVSLSAAGLRADLRDVLGAVVRTGKRVIVAGHSLGGTLALYAGSHLSGIERVVAIAPFLGIARVPVLAHRPLIAGLERVAHRFVWWDPVLREQHGGADGYPRFPLRAIVAGIRLAEDVDRATRRGAAFCAANFVINARETSVNNANVVRIARRWKRTGATATIARLTGLPPTHDIIDPDQYGSDRVRSTLLTIIAAGADDVVRSV